MRPGPSTEALAGPVAVGARIDVHLGGVVVALDIPCEDVQIDWASDRVVPGKLTYTCPSSWVPESPASPLSNYGQRSPSSKPGTAGMRLTWGGGSTSPGKRTPPGR